MSTQDLLGRIEPLLARVNKPIQYVGGEHNSIVKDWQDADVRWVLMYPDAYEVGQSNQGVAILYEVLNERDWILAERTYSVWPDMEKQMRAAGIPQFTLDGHRPVRDFDVMSVSLSTELGYTNMLNAISLAGIPVHQVDRTDDDPIVLIGGHAAFNPEPVADFIDAAVLGDGEEASLEISEIIRSWKEEGRLGGREGLLVRLAETGGVYVPSFYDVEYLDDGTIGRVAPNRPEAPFTVSKHTVMDLDEWQYPKKPIVPVAETVHERYSVEIFRGCTRGCRFCQAGMITRPVRERSIDTIAQMVDNGLQGTGLEEVGLLSLSSADHSEISDITKGLADRYEGTNVSLSLPSTRVDAFNIDLANELSRNGRRSGLTFAPEGGSERMRQVINKQVTEDDLIRTVATAFGNGWRQVKLYFMCGLPTETDEDVLGIHDMASHVIEAVWRDGGVFDGWNEYFSYDRWVACCEQELEPLGVSLDWFTTRERDYEEVLPWDHLDSGLDRDWLWDDWQDALDGEAVDDCRWNPCYDCGVCPQMGTEIQVGPSGHSLIPLTPVNPDLAPAKEA